MKSRLLFWALLASVGSLAQARAQCAATPTYSGRSTYYTPSTGGSLNCSFPDDLQPNLPTVAVSEYRYTDNGQAPASLCGACVEVTGYEDDGSVARNANGSIKRQVFVVRDKCPECKTNQLDIEKDYLHTVGVFGTKDGKNATTFKVVACPITSRVQFALKNGTNAYWSSVQVRNTLYPLAKVEYKKNGAFVRLTRTQDNYFPVDGVGLLGQSGTFRLTDSNGNSITETVTFSSKMGARQGPTVQGKYQFRTCDNARLAADYVPAAAASSLVPSEVQLWPNPGSATVRLAWLPATDQPVRLTLVNAQGVAVQSQLVENLAAYELNTSVLPAGLYHVGLQAGSEKTSTQLLVQH